MAGILKVDQVQSDSNLAINIAGSNVAFFAANTLLMGGNTIISGNKIASTGMPVGSVLQVISTTKNDTFTTTSTSPVDVTGFSATITPISATSKILVSVSIAFGGDDDLYPYVLLLRNGTSIGTGTSATGNRINVFMGGYFTSIASMTFRMHQFSNNFLDSPATTSALTYKIQLANPYQVVSSTAFINRQDNQSDNTFVQYPTSSITLMEIAA